MSNSLGNALKYLRRHVYLHAHNWKTLVVCQSKGQYKHAWDEISRILEAGSLKIESNNFVEGWIQLEKGAMVRFAVVHERSQAEKVKGLTFTQVLWMFEPNDQGLREIVSTVLRSSVVPEDQLVDEKIDW